ncbi:hypothetical protein [Thalassotalea euphylliae]|uniref:Uncharacterized protein n=1 Tax=Thalassotalea euphylliae TaxID=1655234 RepID=A0A3E0U5C5_9GAMM|nr:hypothetical protein [Thalassotalea euphylliae]REL31940.1 hypothetical protein DXX94_15120 [Thalassotalea euphylliae]
MKVNNHFVSYAAGTFENNIPLNRLFAKLFLRPKTITYHCRKDLEQTTFYLTNKDILNELRGAGYWAWKPYYILECMKNVPEGDLIIYHDCGFGYRFKHFIYPRLLIKFAEQYGSFPGVFIPEHGANKKWTKQFAFQQLGCEQSRYREQPQIQATFSIWKNSPKNREFIQAWLAACTDRALVTDDEVTGIDNDVEFVEHRHDQSLLTLLALKAKLTLPNAGDEVIPLNKSISMVELYFRAKSSFVYKLIYRTVLAIKGIKK